MSIFENISAAISSVFSNKMRTFLTMLGIIIGVSSVITITAIGKGFEKSIATSFEILNSKAMQIIVNWGADLTAKDKIFNEDVEKVKEHPNVKYASGYVNFSATVDVKNPNEKGTLSGFGSNLEFAKMKQNFFQLKYGRLFTEQENNSAAKVCLIDEKIAFDIFGRKDVVDEEINLTIKGKEYTFKVVGVTDGKNVDLMGNIMPIPINTALEIFDTKEVDMLYVEAEDTTNLKRTQNEVIRILAASHNTTDDKYLAMSNMEAVDMVNKVLKMFTLFISFVAGISLLVGGIGVMNIMLVTVTERTREIGIRKSLGATDNNIKTQFLIESMVICALGGIFGIIIGYGIGSYLGNMLNAFFEANVGMEMHPPVLSMPVAVGSVIVSTIVGVVFGVYPAGKAAKLDPIEALRYE